MGVPFSVVGRSSGSECVGGWDFEFAISTKLGRYLTTLEQVGARAGGQLRASEELRRRGKEDVAGSQDVLNAARTKRIDAQAEDRLGIEGYIGERELEFGVPLEPGP